MCYEGQEFPSRLLCGSIFAFRLRIEFSAQPVRKLFSRTSIQPGDPEFSPMVSGTVTRPGVNFSRRNLGDDRSLRGVPARTAHMVDLGHYRHAHFLGYPRAYRTVLYRSALHLLYTANR